MLLLLHSAAAYTPTLGGQSLHLTRRSASTVVANAATPQLYVYDHVRATHTPACKLTMCALSCTAGDQSLRAVPLLRPRAAGTWPEGYETPAHVPRQ